MWGGPPGPRIGVELRVADPILRGMGIYKQLPFPSLLAAGGHNVSLIGTPDKQPSPLRGSVLFGNSVAFPCGKALRTSRQVDDPSLRGVR